MRPAFPCGVPSILTPGALADWLWIEPGELEWLADLRGLSRHYNYRLLEKRTGGVRLVESPKARLKAIQQQILEYVLDPVPAHAAAHGFVKGRSAQSFALPHVGQRAVLRMDLRDFFPTLQRARIQSLFRTVGYPERVADLLGGLCTTVTARDVPLDRDARALYKMPHLPQGAPTSPALANLCAYRLDCRLSAFAVRVGGRYTRYADDLAFSGGWEFARRAEGLAPYVGAILAEEGFSANFRKTRVMRPGVRQRLAGLVVNEQLNVAREDFDRLKAVLTNCVRWGALSQNRDGHPRFRAHLEGRVGYVESVNRERGRKLRGILEQILWE